MDDLFKVSVIIPVYNAEKFVEQAVQSALPLEEVGEIILVEDGSPDKALQKCIDLEKKFHQVRLFRHPGGENRGAGASRNLGIQHANCDYISFLDADDYYLANRFTQAREVFHSYPEADFTYGASQMEDDFRAGNDTIRTLSGHYTKRKLFYQLLEGRNGDFDTNTITIRKKTFLKIPLFKTALRLHQDTELWYRMAYHLNGFPACIEAATAVVRRHEQSRITTLNYESRLLMWEELRKEFDPLPLTRLERVLFNMHYNYYRKALIGTPLANKFRAKKIALFTKLLHLFNK